MNIRLTKCVWMCLKLFGSLSRHNGDWGESPCTTLYIDWKGSSWWLGFICCNVCCGCDVSISLIREILTSQPQQTLQHTLYISYIMVSNYFQKYPFPNSSWASNRGSPVELYSVLNLSKTLQPSVTCEAKTTSVLDIDILTWDCMKSISVWYTESLRYFSKPLFMPFLTALSTSVRYT